MTDHFIFDGKCSLDFGCVLFDNATHGTSAREYERIEIPGRSGALLLDPRRYQNVEHSYWCLIAGDAERKFDALRDFIASRTSYRRLEDTIHPDEYYQAFLMEAPEPEFSRDRDLCRFVLTFERKPQRFLKSGERWIQFTSRSSLLNPSSCEAKPLTRVIGTGTFGIGAVTVTIASHGQPHLDIDSDLMEVSCAGTPFNYLVSFSGTSFPTLHEGETGIDPNGKTVSIMPRWYRL